jgi:hypothetical protein
VLPSVCGLGANEGVDERIRQYLIRHAAGGAVINRYTKITAETKSRFETLSLSSIRSEFRLG